jgi:hypothetical protein
MLEPVTTDRQGRPVEFSRDLFLGERTRVVVWSFEVPGDKHPAAKLG